MGAGEGRVGELFKECGGLQKSLGKGPEEEKRLSGDGLRYSGE